MPDLSTSEQQRREAIERIAESLAPMYVEAENSTHPFVARMQPVNPVDLVDHILHEAEKCEAEP